MQKLAGVWELLIEAKIRDSTVLIKDRRLAYLIIQFTKVRTLRMTGMHLNEENLIYIHVT